MAGRPAKPNELKRLQGNPGQRRIPDPIAVLPAATSTPTPPAHFGDAGRAMWDHVWSAGNAWLSQNVDLAILTLLCDAVDDRERLREAIEADGVMTVGSTGQLRVNPAFTAMRAVNAEIIRLLSLIGFTPTDRSRLGLAEVRKQNELEKFLARRTAREA